MTLLWAHVYSPGTVEVEDELGLATVAAYV